MHVLIAHASSRLNSGDSTQTPLLPLTTLPASIANSQSIPTATPTSSATASSTTTPNALPTSIMFDVGNFSQPPSALPIAKLDGNIAMGFQNGAVLVVYNTTDTHWSSIWATTTDHSVLSCTLQGEQLCRIAI